MYVQGGKHSQIYHRNALTVHTDEQIHKYCMYIDKCIHYNFLVLHSGAHIKQEHIFIESEQDSSNKHTQHANEPDNQLYYIT